MILQSAACQFVPLKTEIATSIMRFVIKELG